MLSEWSLYLYAYQTIWQIYIFQKSHMHLIAKERKNINRKDKSQSVVIHIHYIWNTCIKERISMATNNNVDIVHFSGYFLVHFKSCVTNRNNLVHSLVFKNGDLCSNRCHLVQKYQIACKNISLWHFFLYNFICHFGSSLRALNNNLIGYLHISIQAILNMLTTTAEISVSYLDFLGDCWQ